MSTTTTTTIGHFIVDFKAPLWTLLDEEGKHELVGRMVGSEKFHNLRTLACRT